MTMWFPNHSIITKQNLVNVYNAIRRDSMFDIQSRPLQSRIEVDARIASRLDARSRIAWCEMRDLASSRCEISHRANTKYKQTTCSQQIKNSVIAFVTLNVCFSYYVTHTRQLYETQCNNLRTFSSCRSAFWIHYHSLPTWASFWFPCEFCLCIIIFNYTWWIPFG